MSNEKPSSLLELLRLALILTVCVAAVAWLFYFLGITTWEQWPPLRWLCIVPTVIAGVLVALIPTVDIAIRRHSKKCEKCGKWNAMWEFSRMELERKEVMETRTLKEVHRNKKGEVIETVEKEALVPGVDVYYRVVDKCKFCGHVRTYIEIE